MSTWYRYWTHPSPLPASAAPVFHVKPPSKAPLRLGRVIAVANQKGGVGKTTTAVSVAAFLAEAGSAVLLCDLDPQANATSSLGGAPAVGPSAYDVLVDGIPVGDAVVPSVVPGLHFLPATVDLAGAELELASALGREHRLRRALEPALADFDVVLIDCPPSLGLLTVNALAASDAVLVPVQCEYFALEGLGALRRNVDLVRSHLNPGLRILGLVLTMLDGRTRLSSEVVAEVEAHFGELVLPTRIPRSVRLAEAPGFGQPISVFDPSSRGAVAYRALAADVFQRLAQLTPAEPAARAGRS